VSALYTGTIRHRRFTVRRHEFRHRIALAYLDVDHLPPWLVRSRPGLVRFRRADYLGDPNVPLADAVRALVAERLGSAPAGPIRLLTQLRTLGHCFNPVSFYYCFGEDGVSLQAIVAEVTNTPWGERHAYVQAEPGEELAKALHVSPFMPMGQRYTWRATVPGETLSVHIESREGDHRAFDATLSLRREPLTLGGLLRRPALRTVALIYGHAVALKLKGVPVQPHPAR
jgi:DUF1365 family protein